jgi:chromate transporter
MTADESASGAGRPTAASVDSARQPGGSRPDDVVPFGEAVRTWFAISLQTFGGPAGQIAVMHRTLVEEKRWTGQRRFLRALSYCTFWLAATRAAGRAGHCLLGVDAGHVGGDGEPSADAPGRMGCGRKAW